MNLFISILIMTIVSSCNSKDMSIQSYESKKLSVSEIEPMDKALTNSIKWIAPSSWINLKANSIRIASFQLPSDSKMKAEVSIITLSGDGGGDLANINRWRGQLSLDDLTLEQLQRYIIDLKGKLGVYKYISINNEKSKKTILAAFIRSSDKTIYIKASGDSSLISTHEKSFKDFVKGIYEN